MPANAWRASTATSRRAGRGSGRSTKRTSVTRIAEATAKRRPDNRKTGSRATATLPTTIELPTMAMAAAHALEEGDVLELLEGGPCLVEKAEQEVVLGARRGILHPVQDFLVGDGGGAGR